MTGITTSTGSALGITLGGAAGDDFIVDTDTLVVESDTDRVGIGTSTPSQALDVSGTVKATTFSGSGSGLTGTASSLTSGSASGLVCTDCVDGSDLADSITLDANLNIDSGTLYVDQANNRVGIGTSSPDVELEVDGFTMLGSGAPGIAIKEVTGTLDSDGFTLLNHGITSGATKIMLMSCNVECVSEIWFDGKSAIGVNYAFINSVTNTQIQFQVVGSACQGDAFRCFVVYKN